MAGYVAGGRRAVQTGKYKLGGAFVRDPIRTSVVKAEFDRLQKLREQATKAAEANERASTSSGRSS